MNLHIINKLCLMVILLFNSFSLTAQDIPSSSPGKEAEKFRKGGKEEKLKMAGDKVAFLPFEHTYGIREDYALKVANELVYYMAVSQKFQPVSLKKWADEKFQDQAGNSVPDIVAKTRHFHVPVKYICHGIVFKTAGTYALKVALYPIDKQGTPSYYFRTFKNRCNLKYIAAQIVQEMIKRAHTPKQPVLDKRIFIRNFFKDFSLYSIDKSGKTTISKLSFFVYKGVELRKEDHFFNELMLYNFHINRVFEVWNNNMPDYANPAGLVSENEGFDYYIDGQINISKNKTFLSLIVQDVKTKKILFNNKYFLKSLDIDYLYNITRECVQDIIYKLLTEDEEELIGLVDLEGYFGDEVLFCDDFYIGKGNQKDIILPVGITTVTTWFGEELLTEMIIKKEVPGSDIVNISWEKRNYLNIRPEKNVTSEQPFFKVSLGGLIYAGFNFQPLYNDQSLVVFHEENRKVFKLGQILSDKDIKDPFNFQAAYQVGAGIDFSLMSKRFLLFNQLGFKFNHNTSEIKINHDEDSLIEINDEKLKNIDLTYKLTKYNVTFEYTILPAIQFMKNDSPVKMYSGIGLFFNLVYSRYQEQIKGTGMMDLDNYSLNVKHADKHLLFFNSGLFPEFGIITTYSKLNFKIALAYNLEIFKYNIMTNSYYGIMDSFNTSAFQVKIGLGYYLN